MMATVDNRTRWQVRSVRSVVRWVLRELDADHPVLVVRVSETDHWYHHGHFYYGRQNGILTKLLITAYVVPYPDGRGHNRHLRGGPPTIFPSTWRESLVCILAHEGMHVRQVLSPPKGKGHTSHRWKRNRHSGRLELVAVHVDPRRFDEVAAEWAEYRLLERWRKEKKR